MPLAVTACEENGFLNASQELLAKEIYRLRPLPRLHHLAVPANRSAQLAEVQGLALLRIGSMWYSHATVVEERAIFVYPQFRSAKGGIGPSITRIQQTSSRDT